MANYFMDIINQPKDLKKVLDTYFESSFINKVKKVCNLKFNKVIYTGMGSSNFGSIPASLILNNNGINSEVISTGQLVYYRKNILDENTLLVVVSQSGESGETLSLLDAIPQNVKIIGITNNINSTLSKRADFKFILNVMEEESVTTRTYLATLIINYILSKMICGENLEQVKKDLYNSVEILEKFIDVYKDSQSEMLEHFKGVNYISTLGRGASLASVYASGLFLKEVSKFPSEAMDFAEFRHGPIEIVDSNFGCIVFAPKGTTGNLAVNMALKICRCGGKVMLITNMDVEEKDSNLLILKYDYVDEYMSSIIDVAGAQLLCCKLAEVRGFVPGKFRWSSKITQEQ